MRRPVFSRPSDLDLNARELIAAAARRAGMSLDEWTASVLEGAQGKPVSSPRRAGSDLDSVIPRVSPSPRSPSRQDYESLMAAVAQEGERQAKDQAAQTAIALESMAHWIEQAEIRLNEATRGSADQQDRIAAVLSQALASLKNRLDSVERKVTAERASPARIEFPMEEALKALAPVSETLTGLRADMSRLTAHLEQPHSFWAPAVEGIRTEIDGLRAGIESLATRDEIAALGAALGSIGKELEQGPTTKDLRTLASSITVLYEQVQSLSEDVSDGLHRRIGREIDQIKGKIDALASTGVDRSVVDFLSGQIVDMRQDLAHRAEPQQIARLSDDIGTISRQLSELRLHQVSKSDFTALKTSLDDVCSALYVTATAQETSKVPEQLETLSRRIDALVRRPDPVSTDLAPISAQLALLTERMANLSESRVGGSETLTGTIERLTSRIDAVAERETASHEPLMRRFDRIEQELRELARQPDATGMAQMLRSIDEKLERTPPHPAGLDNLERQIRTLTERFEQVPGEALHTVLTEATGHLRSLQDEAVGIAERAARTVLNDIRPSLPATGDLDVLKHGFVELKALHNRSDRKTQETLRAVHDALEALVSRLPNETAISIAGAVGSSPSLGVEPLQPADRLEAAVRRLHAATLTQIEETAPAPLDKISREPSMAQAPDVAPEPDLGTVRADFIAAARRAVQNTAPELQPAARASSWEAKFADTEEPESDDFLPPPGSFFERLRRSLDNRRRPLLFGLAFLILAAGTYQILSVTQNLQDLSLVPASVQAPAQPAPAMRADEAGNPPAAEETNLFQSSSLATGSIPSDPVPAGQFLVDPATIDGIPADTPAALQHAALSGDAAALYELASRAAEGRGMARDAKAAARLFERVAQAGLPPAQERLAMMHEKGEGVPLDLKQAAFWYERAALGGNIRAMHNLATVLASGKNGKPDYAAALRWYAEAAEYGLRDSQYNLGVLLARGIGARPDRSKAYRWFSLAADQGDPEAGQKREEIAVFMSQAEIKAAKAALELWRPRTADPVANKPPGAAQGQTAVLDRTPGNRS
ncbi:SEL1-like repeat protein [Microvirga mediterraneensis]|uniref:SEL1-like repeat protein n=1 Tax=Microvirga mediterraneensis TaxID=2754695 RepID=A0A838BLU8_9HYPH|nr:SEL1-like repeat protein [Microvirga mediterraneensis]MBA1156059.1 SEL1-like repeat protein [Microvirga mediterraneensis]